MKNNAKIDAKFEHFGKQLLYFCAWKQYTRGLQQGCDDDSKFSNKIEQYRFAYRKSPKPIETWQNAICSYEETLERTIELNECDAISSLLVPHPTLVLNLNFRADFQISEDVPNYQLRRIERDCDSPAFRNDRVKNASYAISKDTHDLLAVVGESLYCQGVVDAIKLCGKQSSRKSFVVQVVSRSLEGLSCYPIHDYRFWWDNGDALRLRESVEIPRRKIKIFGSF